MKAQPRNNPSLLRPGGVIGRRDYFVNILICAGLLGFSVGYLTILDRAGVTTPMKHESPIHAALVLALMLPSLIAALLTAYALPVNMLKRIRDLTSSSRRGVLWAAALLIPVVGLLAQAALLLRDGATSRSAVSPAAEPLS